MRVAVTPDEIIDRRIYILRNQKVMLDGDIAVLYGVVPDVLRQQVKRNAERFPADFLFHLTGLEVRSLLSEGVAIQSKKPYAFTEQGVAMLSSILESQCAAQVDIAIMRGFVRMREMLLGHYDLFRQIQEMELRYDDDYSQVFHAIRALTEAQGLPRRERAFARAC